MTEQNLDQKQKAFTINLTPGIYGTFAEIGAGQEVARFFFRAGGAAGTIAKSMSAYDMIVSDAVYGKEASGRYVCEDRLQHMLDHEYSQLIERLGKTRGGETTFFAFADTVAAKSFRGKGDNHGWLGLRFQHEPQAEASDLILHVKMHDQVNLQQQEALGMVGVNLIYACYFLRNDREVFIESLMDGLTTDRIEIDMIRINGPAFSDVDERVLCLELVKKNFCKAILFNEQGRVMQAADCLYKKNVLLSRGSFRPPTLVNMDMLKTGLEKFKEELPKDQWQNILVLPEISMSKLLERGKVDNEDFLARVELLNSLNHKVMISNFEFYHHLSRYVVSYSRNAVAFVVGVYNLEEIFNPERYEDFPSGLLGGIGQLFGKRTQMFVYPAKDDQSAAIMTIENSRIQEDQKLLLPYLLHKKYMSNITSHDPKLSEIWSRTVLRMIQNDESGWEEMVPSSVAKIVKKKKLFRHQGEKE